MRGYARIVAVAALVLSLGLHWAFLQAVAWGGMLISYSRSALSIQQAINMTFDGQHPCSLCKTIQKAKKEERKESPQQPRPGGKLDLGLPWERAEFVFCSEPVFAGELVVQEIIRTDPPPKPRPRSLAG